MKSSRIKWELSEKNVTHNGFPFKTVDAQTA